MIASPRGRTACGNILAAGHHEKRGPENHEEARNDLGESQDTCLEGRLDHYNRVSPNHLVATPDRARAGVQESGTLTKRVDQQTGTGQ